MGMERKRLGTEEEGETEEFNAANPSCTITLKD